MPIGIPIMCWFTMPFDCFVDNVLHENKQHHKTEEKTVIVIFEWWTRVRVPFFVDSDLWCKMKDPQSTHWQHQLFKESWQDLSLEGSDWHQRAEGFFFFETFSISMEQDFPLRTSIHMVHLKVCFT